MFRPKTSINHMTERFRKVFEAHNIEASQIPRLIPQIKYEDFQLEARLLAALTPEVIDATAKLFGIRPEWLEGLDDMPYQVAWSRGSPKNLLTRLSDAITTRGKDQNHFPLRVLTTSMNLDRQGKHQQWLLPVIVETVDELGDTLIHRCQFVGNHYDWTNEQARLELKALAWVVFHQFRSPVSLYQVTPKEMEQFMLGQLIPSVLWRKGWLSEPSLEDYALSEQESRKAKETDEQAKLLAYLDASGLKEWRLEDSPLLSKTDSPEPAPSENTTSVSPPTPEKPAPGKRMASGKKVNPAGQLGCHPDCCQHPLGQASVFELCGHDPAAQVHAALESKGPERQRHSQASASSCPARSAWKTWTQAQVICLNAAGPL